MFEVAIEIRKPSFVVKLLKKLGKKIHAHWIKGDRLVSI